jgi:hypothetical protein
VRTQPAPWTCTDRSDGDGVRSSADRNPLARARQARSHPHVDADLGGFAASLRRRSVATFGRVPRRVIPETAGAMCRSVDRWRHRRRAAGEAMAWCARRDAGSTPSRSP